MNTEKYTEYINYLDNHLKKPTTISGFIGFDGFIDEIIDVVAIREDVNNYRRFININDFVTRIKSAVGKSTNLELVTRQTKLGGNGPIMANSIANHGLDTTFIGTINNANNDIHPVFLPMKEKMTTHSIGIAAHTDALEFTDGKIMLGKIGSTHNITWEKIINTLGKETLDQLIKTSKFMGFVNWTMIPFMNDIWEKFIEKFHQFKIDKTSHIFIDLADFAKRTPSDCLNAIKIMQKMAQYVYVTLGMNLKEAKQLGEIINIKLENESEKSIIKFSKKLFDKLKLDSLAVHPHNYAVAITKNGIALGHGPFTTNPKISTGAGDHFNAGYFTGKLIGMPNHIAVINGVLNSGFYVRTAVSPSLENLREFATLWHEGKEELIREMYSND